MGIESERVDENIIGQCAGEFGKKWALFALISTSFFRDEENIAEGFVTKLGHHVKKWRARYFVLRMDGEWRDILLFSAVFRFRFFFGKSTYDTKTAAKTHVIY